MHEFSNKKMKGINFGTKEYKCSSAVRACLLVFSKTYSFLKDHKLLGKTNDFVKIRNVSNKIIHFDQK